MTRVLIADDHAMFREGVRSVLETEPDIEVAGETGTGVETIRACAELRPDVVLLDLDMPDLDGMDVMRRITDEKLPVKVVILTMFTNKDYAVRLLSAGASAFVPKYSSGRILPQVIRTVMNGEMYVPDEMKDIVIQSALGRNKSEIQSLSDREIQVLTAIAEGLSTKEIAGKYNISPRTVETHQKRLMDKLGLKNKPDVYKAAIRMGLVRKY
jgi:DNA-binding NarL/FixJ family response regulator